MLAFLHHSTLGFTVVLDNLTAKWPAGSAEGLIGEGREQSMGKEGL